MIARSLGTASWLLVLTASASAQVPAAPGAREPVLRVEAGGPTAFVTALAFGPDGKTLYAGGYDKVVRAWVLDPKTDRLVPGPSYRVPIGAGVGGVINAVAVSADGQWLAAAGSGAVRGIGNAREVGWVVPRTGGLTKEMRQDEGAIWIFNTRTGAVRALRGHEGPVLSLAFDPAPAAGGPMLVSAAAEKAAGGDGYVGAVRLWALDRDGDRAEVARRTDLPYPYDKTRKMVIKPALALYPGARPKQATVALAWEDGRFRVWDVAHDKVWDGQSDGSYNNTVVCRPEEKRFLTASVRGSAGRLQVWYLAEDDSPWPHETRHLGLEDGRAPRALALVSARADGQCDHAAVVLRAPSRGEEFSLQLIDLDTFRAAGKSVVLWRGTPNEPVLAAAPKGRFLAVAGNADHTIRLYAINDLLKGKADLHQPPLRSDGATVRHVGFVRKGKDRGLVFGEGPEEKVGAPPRDPAEGDLVFDFAAGALAAEWQAWTKDAPDVKGWTVEQKDRPEGTVLLVTHDNRARRVALRPGQTVTAAALLPASPPPLRVPLLAVASVEKGETLLGLYHAETGEQVRQCTGPVNPIRSLAFTGDGRLLAAAADDQTVSVWGLTTLDEVIGRHGLLRGLAVKEGDKGAPVVAEVDELTGVRPNDVIDGLVMDGQLKATATPRDFYRAIWEVAPSKQKTVTLQVGGRQVPLAVSQGVDERKPLLSLFVTAGRGARREWVGWSPVGPYDCSGRDADRLIGWHINTGETEKPPVRFALADQFRKDNYKPGILRKLTEYGNPGQAIDAWQREHDGPPPDPEMTFGVKDDGLPVPPDRPNHFRVRQRRVTLTLALDGFPADRVGSVAWRALGKQGALTPAGDGEWTADLSDLPWERGDQAVRVLLRTAPPHARDYAGALTVRYEPPAPRVEALREHPGATDRQKYPIALKVTPGQGQAVRVTVLLKSKPVLKWKDVREAREVRTELDLAAGENRIQVVAENQGAPEGAASDAERSRWDRGVTYRVPRPQITLRKLVFEDESERAIDPERSDTPLVVDVPTFRVAGEIEALADLAGAEWAAGEDRPAALAGFDAAGKLRKVHIDQAITLREPGRRKLRFLARVAGGDETERTVTVEYRPRLPAAKVTDPGNHQDFYEGETPPRVPVEAALIWPRDPHPCRARLLVNGQEQGKPRPIAAGAKTFKGEAVLRPGENRIEVRLSSAWQTGTEGAEQVVYYRRPPRVVKVATGTPGDRPPRAEIVATVESANDLPLESAALTVWQERADGLTVTADTLRALPVSPAEMTPSQGDKVTVWTIRKTVNLDEGMNVVRLVASNKDGAARKPGTVSVPYRKPPPPRPAVAFLKPQDDLAVESRAYEVHFVVTSEGPLTKVELRRGADDVLFAATPEQLRAQKKEGASYKFEATPRVSLKRGANLLSAVTANQEGGEAVTPYKTISYHYRPVIQVHIDALEVNGRVRRPEGEPPKGGPLPFARVPVGRVTLAGHVSWDEEHGAALAALRHLEVSVNGYHQPPALLALPAAGERRRDFKVDVLLNEPNNVIDVAPPRSDPPFAVEAGSRLRCQVACDAPVPVRRQLLHLLVINVDGDRDKAVKEALDAILGDHLTGRDFKVCYCTDGGHLYGPLAGDEVIPEAVYGQMALIQQNLGARARAGARNDVVMVYYRGGLVNKDGGQFLHSSLSRRAREPRPSTLISCDHLARFLADSPGAQLVFLDVTGAPGTRDRRADLVTSRSEPHVAVMRCTWNGEPDKRPAEARMRPNLERAMTKARELEQMRQELTTPFVRQDERQPWPSRRYPNEWWYDDWLPPALEGLRLGGGPAAP